MPKHPDIEVQLTGEDGNALAIVARVRNAMRAAGIDPEEIGQFTNEALDGDYNHLLRTCGEYVSVG